MQQKLYLVEIVGNLLKYKGIIVKVYYAQYTFNNISYPAYCLDKTKQGVTDNLSYSVSIKDSIKDVKLWRYIINGYPYKSIEELGCANKEEAFTATKQAIYCYIHGNNVEDYSPIGEAGQRTLNALKQIVENANNSTETQISNIITIKKLDNFFKVDENKPEYASKTYKIEANGQIKDYKINLSSENSSILENVIITDINSNEKYSFSPNESFKILIPIKNMTSNNNFKIQVNTQIKNKPVFYGIAENNSYQDYALTAETYEDTIQNITEEYNKNETKIKLIKKDNQTNALLENVEFSLYNSNKDIIYTNLKTDKNGEILIENLIPGTYYIKETKSKDGYILNNEFIKIDVKFNETVTITINNSKEEKPTIERTENTLEFSNIKKLPVTGK